MGKSLTRRIFEDVESGRAKKLGLSDTFQFECKQCGKCCYKIDVLLTPYDIMRLCDNLDLSSTEFLDKYGYTYLGPESGLPVVIIDFKGKDACPFLRPDGCSVYKDRPGPCRSYPIGRMIDSEGEITYFLMQPPDFCTAQKTFKTQTLQDWLKESEIEEYHKMNDKFVKIFLKLTKSKVSELGEKILWVVSEILYNFDSTLPMYAKAHNLSVSQTHDEKLSMISQSIGDLIDIISKGKPEIKKSKNELRR